MLMILRGGGTMPLGPLIGAFPDAGASDLAHELAVRKSMVGGWHVLRMAIALPTRSPAIPRPRLSRPGINAHAPTGKVSRHG
jgi:hypothetical protein